MKENRWVKLGAGIVVLLFAGIIYAWSILKAPLSGAFGWTGSALQLNFTVMMCCFCLGGLVSGLLSKRFSACARLVAAAVLAAGGFLGVSFLGDKIALLYLCYGVMLGTGIGIVYNVVISATNAWFPDKKGLCSGLLMMAFGFSTLILGSTASALISGMGWRGAYRVLAAAIGLVILGSAFIVRMPEGKKAARKAASENDIEARDMIRRASFWKLFAFFMLLAAVGSTAISFAKDYMLSLAAAESLSVAVVGAVSISNGLGRLASGAIFDRFGLRKTQYVTSAVAIIAPLVALVALLTKCMPLGVAGLCLCGFSYGFSPTVSAAFAGAFYGQRNFALNFSVLNLVLIPASFAATLAGGLSYQATFIMLAAFSAVGLMINLGIRKA